MQNKSMVYSASCIHLVCPSCLSKDCTTFPYFFGVKRRFSHFLKKWVNGAFSCWPLTVLAVLLHLWGVFSMVTSIEFVKTGQANHMCLYKVSIVQILFCWNKSELWMASRWFPHIVTPEGGVCYVCFSVSRSFLTSHLSKQAGLHKQDQVP
jgi:hypothetical protein